MQLFAQKLVPKVNLFLIVYFISVKPVLLNALLVCIELIIVLKLKVVPLDITSMLPIAAAFQSVLMDIMLMLWIVNVRLAQVVVLLVMDRVVINATLVEMITQLHLQLLISKK